MNVDKLKGHVPDSIIAEIPSVSNKFGVNTGLRLAHFLAQTGHESGGFKVFSENLNYGAKGLVGIFGKYFTAHDERRGTDFAKTFPELEEFFEFTKTIKI